jgi:NADPH-dependent 2,4-dienoyl-CoA reductase/sulfur reductase-like enzyme
MTDTNNRALVPAQQRTTKPYLDSADIVIIGNGIAGLTAAVEARRHAPDKRIVIVTEQIHPTINTPALKQFAIGKLTREQLLAYPAGTERAERIHVVTTRVEEIHAQSKYLTLSGKRGFGYGSLLIATGSKPMGLPNNIPGHDFDGVLTLHRLNDYLDFRRRLGEVSDAVVIGGGVHAIETVMGLLHWGVHVHWLIHGETFMRGMLDQPASEMVLERIRKLGVEIHTSTEVMGVMGRVGSVAGVLTNHKQMIPCQMVLSCTGTQPVTALADSCTLTMRHKKGILVDDQLRTSVPHVFAAGDVAALKNPQTGHYEPRAQWYAAVMQGRIAGAMLSGHDELARQPFGVMWHATHLGDLSLLTVGDPLVESNTIQTLSDTSASGYRRITLEGDRLVGYLSLGSAQPDSLAIKRIIDERISVRNVIKALLRGKFDARQYLSQQRSRLAQGVLTGQLPPLEESLALPINAQLTPLPPTELPATKLLSDPGVLEEDAPVAPRQPAAQEPQVFYEEIRSFSGALPPLQQPTWNDADQYAEEEEVSPFTGNLPFISHRESGELERESEELPAARMNSANFLSSQLGEPDLFTEEVSPFTGNLPTLKETNETGSIGGNQRRERVVDSTLAAAPGEHRRKTGGLWAYADEKPVQGNKRRQEPVEDDELPKRRPSSSLWSYTGKEKSVRVGKGR